MITCLPCLCICGCVAQIDPHQYVCRFCAAMWRSRDKAHAPPNAGECERLRALQTSIEVTIG